MKLRAGVLSDAEVTARIGRLTRRGSTPRNALSFLALQLGISGSIKADD